MAKPSPAQPSQVRRQAMIVAASLVAVLWILFSLAYLSQTIGLRTILALPPTELGPILLGVASVPGMIAMALGYFAALRRLERANRIMARHFRDFTKFSAGERQQITQSSEAARQESLSLFEAAQASLAALNQIQDSLKLNTLALIDAAGQSTGAIDSAGRQIEDRAAALRQLSEAFEANANALQAVLTRIDQTQNGLDGHTTLFDQAVEKLGGAASLLEARAGQIQRTGAAVTGNLQEIDDAAASSHEAAGRLEAAAGRLHTGLDGIRTNIAETSVSIDRYGEISDRMQHYQHETKDGLNLMHNIAINVVEAMGRIRAQQRGANQELEIFGRHSADLEGVGARMQAVFGDLNQKASEISFVVSTAVNRLGDLSRSLAEVRGAIDDTTNGASDRMAQTAAAMRAEFGSLQEVASRAVDQLQRTLASLAATSATLDNETQTLEQRIATTFRIAEAGSAEFSRQMSAALEEINRAEQFFIDGQARITGSAQDSSAHLLQLTAGLATGGAELGKAALAISERIVTASSVVETRLQAVGQIGDTVRSTIGSFATELNDVTLRSDGFTQLLADRSAILKDNIVQIVRTAEEATESVKATTAYLLNSTIEISDAAGKTRTEIVRATAELKRESAAIADTEAQSRALTGQVAALLGERAMELAQTARKVAAETVTMREANAKFQRDMFLSAANTVLHALTSLSVDISRVLDADLPEELRRELVRGDIPGFVQRLAARRSDISTPKIRARFATDTRFRNHVQTYLSQFEELLRQSAKVDQGAVLSATLVSSDIGKIYTFLSAAISTERDTIKEQA